MEAISVKLDKALLKHLDQSLREFHYSTRTDFIREAIRERLRDLSKERAMMRIEQNRGTAKKQVSDKRLHEIREQAVREYERKRGWNLK